MRSLSKNLISGLLLLFSIFSLPSLTFGQNKAKIILKPGELVRLPSDSKKMVDVVFTIVIPADKDTTNKKANYAIQDSLKMGKLVIELDKAGTTADIAKLTLAAENTFKIDSLKKENQFKYTLRVPRDSLDDKLVILKLTASDVKGKEITQLKTKMRVYIKPFIPDTLANNEKLELWFHTGTNFDLFDGIKAQEFFFRANMFFKITDGIYAQTAFYKNRYFAEGQNNASSREFYSVKQPLLGEKLYTFTQGIYKQSTKQTIDPLAWQLDFLYKLTKDDRSNFFVNLGVDISTTTVSIENVYSIDTLKQFQTTRPDTVPNEKSYVTDNFTKGFKYRKPAYNMNFGVMWVYNDQILNIKSQLLFGQSSFTDLLYIQETKGGTRYVFEAKKRFYMQARIMATYKPLGLSFGMEAFMRKNEVPAFNFTLSKAFDLKKLVSNFTPVSGLKIQ